MLSFPAPVPVWLLTAWGFPEVRWNCFLGSPYLGSRLSVNMITNYRIEGKVPVYYIFLYITQNVLKTIFQISKKPTKEKTNLLKKPGKPGTLWS